MRGYHCGVCGRRPMTSKLFACVKCGRYYCDDCAEKVITCIYDGRQIR